MDDAIVYIHSDCHIESPTWCSYRNGILSVECSICKKHITSFKAEMLEDNNKGKENQEVV